MNLTLLKSVITGENLLKKSIFGSSIKNNLLNLKTVGVIPTVIIYKNCGHEFKKKIAMESGTNAL